MPWLSLPAAVALMHRWCPLVWVSEALTKTDGVVVSFWIISIAMIAATVFFYAETGTVLGHWKTSLHVGRFLLTSMIFKTRGYQNPRRGLLRSWNTPHSPGAARLCALAIC